MVEKETAEDKERQNNSVSRKEEIGDHAWRRVKRQLSFKSSQRSSSVAQNEAKKVVVNKEVNGEKDVKRVARKRDGSKNRTPFFGGANGSVARKTSAFWSDISNPKLLLIKAVFFLEFAALTVLVPHLDVHLGYLGITIYETMVVHSVVPLVSVLGPLLVGYAADRFGNLKTMLSALSALSGALVVFLLLLPKGRDIVTFPKTMPMALSCGLPGTSPEKSRFVVYGFKEYHCRERELGGSLLSLRPTKCGYMCAKTSIPDFGNGIASYQVNWADRAGFGIKEIVSIVSFEGEGEELEAKKYFQVFNDSIFFPLEWRFGLSCDRIKQENCAFDPKSSAFPVEDTLKVGLKKTTREVNQMPVYTVTRLQRSGSESTVSEGEVDCSLVESKAQILASVRRSDRIASSRDGARVEQSTSFNGCSLLCMFEIERKVACSNAQIHFDYDPTLTFYVYLLLRGLHALASTASWILFEPVVLVNVEKYHGEYGLQRACGHAGAVFAASVISAVMNSKPTAEDSDDFSSAFYAYFALQLLLAILVTKLEYDRKISSKGVLKRVKSAMFDAKVGAHFFVVVCAGVFSGYLATSLPTYIHDLYFDVHKRQTSSLLIFSISLVVGNLSSMLLLIMTTSFWRNHTFSVMLCGMVFYFIHLLVLSEVGDPWHVLWPETLEGFTTGLLVSTGISYLTKVGSTTNRDSASESLILATIVGIFGAFYLGVGRGIGSILGAVLNERIGSRNGLRYFAVNAIVVAILYSAFYICYVQRRDPSKTMREAVADPVVEDSKQTVQEESGGKNIEEKDEVRKEAMIENAA